MKVIRRFVSFILDNSLLLIIGALAGLCWANLGSDGYHALRDFRIPLFGLHLRGEAEPGITVHFLVNGVLMAFFFAVAGKEVWTALLPGGSLRNARRAATPVVCTLGGMAGPAILYALGALLIGRFSTLGRGWAIPCATDVAFSYLIARAIFGRHHPAIPFLLLLAIADDAGGLLILAVFYPLQPVEPLWLLLPLAAFALGLAMRRMRVRSFWWYLLFPGALSWVGFALSGLHPALGLLPVIPTLPHGRHQDEEVHWGASKAHNTLDEFESWWSTPVEVILGLFGLLNAGVALSAVGAPTVLVLVGLVAGKPLGILLSGIIAVKLFGLLLPEGVRFRELLVVGCAAGIGFTVALFVATVAFAPGALQDAAKMGALGSCLAAGVTFLASRLVRAPAKPTA
jgi:NhaA family Na+:H+ antiporter